MLRIVFLIYIYIYIYYAKGCNLVLEFFNHIYHEYFCYMLCIISNFRGDIIKFISWELWNLCEHVLFFFFGSASYPWLWHVLFDFRVFLLISWSNAGWRSSNLGFWVKFDAKIALYLSQINRYMLQVTMAKLLIDVQSLNCWILVKRLIST